MNVSRALRPRPRPIVGRHGLGDTSFDFDGNIRRGPHLARALSRQRVLSLAAAICDRAEHAASLQP